MAVKEAPIKKEKVNNPQIVKQDFSVDKVLVENFVSLQKVMTNLAIKFDSLSTQISKLLELFEISAKTLAEKDYDKKDDSKKIVEKLDVLLDHDKIIARGIAALHEKANAEQPQEILIPSQPVQRTMPMNYPPQQQMQQRPQPPSRVIETDRFQKLPSQSTQKTREMGM